MAPATHPQSTHPPVHTHSWGDVSRASFHCCVLRNLTASLLPVLRAALRNVWYALQVVAIANDITYQSGAFGPREDCLFKAATELALEERLPLIYLAANRWGAVGRGGHN